MGPYAPAEQARSNTSMYHKFYGFKEAPFNMTPNSRFFFESTKHLEALSTLAYAIESRKGFVVITGEIGSGKTTVCRTLLNRLDATTQTALITNTYIGGRDLLITILEDLEIEYTPGSKAHLLSQLNQYLIEQLRNDHNVILIIDEAQNLKPAVLEEVRMLSNLETENEKLIQIIFLGQPELKKKLALPRLEQLRQRIAVYYHLTPLSQEDTIKYIHYRLRIASASGRAYFTDGALDMIYQFSQGVPRLINQVCDSALLNGFIYEKEIIDEKLMREVIHESPVNQITIQEEKKSRIDEEFERIIQK
jgi:general secretion pathway protein A